MSGITALQPFIKCGFCCKDYSLNISVDPQMDDRGGGGTTFYSPHPGSVLISTLISLVVSHGFYKNSAVTSGEELCVFDLNVM